MLWPHAPCIQRCSDGVPQKQGPPEPHGVKQHCCAGDTRALPYADLGWLKLALVGLGQNCAKHLTNDTDSQVPVGAV